MNQFQAQIPNFQFPNFFRKSLRGVILFLVILLLLGKALIIIPAGNTGVFHLFGRVSDKPLSSGLHIINPLGKVTVMSIRTEEYTMSIAYGEGRRAQADAITALTKEGLAVDLDITVLFHLMEEKAPEVFKSIGLDYDEKIIRPGIRSNIRGVIAQYEAKAIYSEKREEAAQKIRDELKAKLEPRGIVIEDVLLRHVQLPPKLAESIQVKLSAEQEAQRMEFVLEKETKEAERKRIEAKGQRDAQKIINESLTDRYLQYLYIQSLKDLDGTIYVPTNPNTGLPLFRNIP
jgi:regulator of protease activity HflC (stomatin/prohibitin superfamily)